MWRSVSGLVGEAEGIDRLVDGGMAGWPRIRTDRETFKQYLSQFAGEDLASVHSVDLYLAFACVSRAPGAVEEFTAKYVAPVVAHVARLSAGIRADDLRVELEDRLMLGRHGAAPGLARYTGRGPLRGFVSTAARNAAISMLRGRSKVAASDEANAAGATRDRSSGEMVMISRYEGTIREAVRGALRSLDRRQRTIVRLHISQNITLTRIAAMLHVHQSTISRQFQAAMQGVYEDVRRRLREVHGLQESELVSVVRDLRSHVDLSLSRVLGDSESNE